MRCLTWRPGRPRCRLALAAAALPLTWLTRRQRSVLSGWQRRTQLGWAALGWCARRSWWRASAQCRGGSWRSSSGALWGTGLLLFAIATNDRPLAGAGAQTVLAAAFCLPAPPHHALLAFGLLAGLAMVVLGGWRVARPALRDRLPSRLWPLPIPPPGRQPSRPRWPAARTRSRSRSRWRRSWRTPFDPGAVRPGPAAPPGCAARAPAGRVDDLHRAAQDPPAERRQPRRPPGHPGRRRVTPRPPPPGGASGAPPGTPPPRRAGVPSRPTCRRSRRSSGPPARPPNRRGDPPPGIARCGPSVTIAGWAGTSRQSRSPARTGALRRQARALARRAAADAARGRVRPGPARVGLEVELHLVSAPSEQAAPSMATPRCWPRSPTRPGRPSSGSSTWRSTWPPGCFPGTP